MSVDDKEITGLYQKGKEQEPPERLDQVILKAAREAVEKKPADATARSPFSGAWLVAMPVAAVLVIVVILAPFIKQYQSPAPVSSRPELDESSLMAQKKQSILHQSAQKNEIKKRSLYKSKASSDKETSISPMPVAPVDKPEVWLKEIRLLLDEGKIDLARDELDRLKLVYPGKKIDRSLLQQLEAER